jgi:tRNA dimethylallyltransferase
MSDMFFLVGPTAVGKSVLAAEIAAQVNAEIVNVDAFQIYCGLDVLTGKPDATTQREVPHHLLGSVALAEPMSAAKFRKMALSIVSDIQSRHKRAMLVGGSGLYIKALSHGLDAPAPDPETREQLRRLSLKQLTDRLNSLDPVMASRVDLKNPRRVLRAVEIATSQTTLATAPAKAFGIVPSPNGEDSMEERQVRSTRGVLLVRDRDDLYQRINRRVEGMFRQGVVDEVRNVKDAGPTAAHALGLHQIQQLIAGEISRDDCVRSIQLGTRRYAKRQLTWFRRQSNFPELNLTTLSHRETLRAIRDYLAPA